MSEDRTTAAREVRRLIRALEKMHHLAHQATMTGALEDGQGYAILQFNAILAALTERGIVLPFFLPPLPDDATFGAVGIASAQLAEYLDEYVKEELGETGGPGSPESGRRSRREGSPFAAFNQVFGGSDWKQFGEVMREAMPEWMRAAQEARGASATGASPAEQGAAGAAEAAEARERTTRLAEVSAKMQAAAEQMQQEGISLEELQRLAADLARLGQEQSRIARGE